MWARPVLTMQVEMGNCQMGMKGYGKTGEQKDKWSAEERIEAATAICDPKHAGSRHKHTEHTAGPRPGKDWRRSLQQRRAKPARPN